MRYILLSLLLLFGCTSTPTEKMEEKSIVPQIVQEEKCEPTYSFSELEDGTFGKSSEMIATVSCLGGRSLEVTINGKSINKKIVESNETTVVELNVPGMITGEIDVGVLLDGEIIHQRSWNVEYLGNKDIVGTNFDTISFKEWIGIRFDIDETVELGQIRSYMKRQNPKTLPNSNILVELRKDSGNKPGMLVDEVRMPIDETTLSSNWMKFNFDKKVKLSPGKYWVVMKIEQLEDTSLTSDTVTIHAVTVDKEKPGNDYTTKMSLKVDLVNGKASETEWTALPYDKNYNIVLSSGE